jgi:hypothetical protein
MNRPKRVAAQSSLKDDEIVDTDDEEEPVLSRQTRGKSKKVGLCLSC